MQQIPISVHLIVKADDVEQAERFVHSRLSDVLNEWFHADLPGPFPAGSLLFWRLEAKEGGEAISG